MSLALRGNNQDALDWMDTNLSAGDKRPYETGYVENWEATLGQFIDEDLSISRMLNGGGEHNDYRVNEIMKLRESGAIEESVFNMFLNESTGRGMSPVDWSALAEYAQEKLGRKDILTDDQINKDIRDELKLKRDYAQGVRDKANFAGQAGAVFGTLQGAMLDPMVWPAMFVAPVRAAQSMSYLRVAGSAFAKEAALASIEEIMIQPLVYSWKQTIESPYTVGDALLNIAAAGVGGGTLGAIGASARKGIKMRLPNDPEADEAKKWLRWLVREVDNAPDENMKAKEHFDNIEDAVKSVNERKPVRMDTLEPEEPLDDAVLNQTFKTVIDENPDMPNVELSVDSEGKVVTRQVGTVADAMQETDDLMAKLNKAKVCLGG